MLRGSRLLWCLMAMAVLVLPGCGGKDSAAKTEIDLGELLPPSLQAIEVQRLDLVPGTPAQWLVLYKYDAAEHFSPIAGVVYRADRGGKNQPRIIYPYPLRLPDRDYLGTGNVSVRPQDVLSAWDGVELVAENKNTDGFVTEAAVFVWHDSYPNDTWRKPEEGRFYECMGYFRSEGEVVVQHNEVIVKELENDRSQLARYYKYRPDAQGRYLAQGAELRPSVDSWVDFAFPQTGSVADSPYPEKIVLAFYNAIGGPADGLRAFLSKEAQERLKAGDLDYGCGWQLGEVKKVTIRQVGYHAAVEAQTKEEEDRESLVELKIRCEPKLAGKSKEVTAAWYLKRETGQWKMDRFYDPTK